MLKTRKNQKGFTLTELIIVIVIIGILAAVLIPTLSSYVTRAKKSAAEQNALADYHDWVAKEGEDAFSDEEMAELLVAHYYVESGNYIVEILNGGVKHSALKSETTDAAVAAYLVTTGLVAFNRGTANVEKVEAAEYIATPGTTKYLTMNKDTVKAFGVEPNPVA